MPLPDDRRAVLKDIRWTYGLQLFSCEPALNVYNQSVLCLLLIRNTYTRRTNRQTNH